MKKEELDRAFARDPMKKYKYVVSKARAEVGLDGEHYPDPSVVKKYFIDHVNLSKYKLCTHVLELMVEVHAAILSKNDKRALGLVAGCYQMLEQYVVDGSDMYMATMATHLPRPATYAAPGVDAAVEPYGRLLEPEIAAASTAYQTDVEKLRTAREARKKR